MSKDLSGRKPILCLDFDGVCHSYTSGWKGADTIPDDPVPGLFEFLADASQHFEIDIFSSRSNQEGGLQAMKQWFLNKYVEWHTAKFPGDSVMIAKDQAVAMIDKVWKFPTEKPPAFLGIDDRVLTFTGNWPSIEEMKNFKTWNAKEV